MAQITLTGYVESAPRFIDFEGKEALLLNVIEYHYYFDEGSASTKLTGTTKHTVYLDGANAESTARMVAKLDTVMVAGEQVSETQRSSERSPTKIYVRGAKVAIVRKWKPDDTN